MFIVGGPYLYILLNYHWSVFYVIGNEWFTAGGKTGETSMISVDLVVKPELCDGGQNIWTWFNPLMCACKKAIHVTMCVTVTHIVLYHLALKHTQADWLFY